MCGEGAWWRMGDDVGLRAEEGNLKTEHQITHIRAKRIKGTQTSLTYTQAEHLTQGKKLCRRPMTTHTHK